MMPIEHKNDIFKLLKEYKVTPLSDIITLSLEALVFFILTYAMHNYYKRRKLKLRK